MICEINRSISDPTTIFISAPEDISQFIVGVVDDDASSTNRARMNIPLSFDLAPCLGAEGVFFDEICRPFFRTASPNEDGIAE